jgi:hypothetical protein
LAPPELLELLLLLDSPLSSSGVTLPESVSGMVSLPPSAVQPDTQTTGKVTKANRESPTVVDRMIVNSKWWSPGATEPAS